MIEADKRVAIFELHAAGAGTRRIAVLLKISRNAVKEVLRSGQRDVPPLERVEALTPHHDFIRAQVVACKGNLVRVHEELHARGVEVGYSTLTAYVRRHELELGVGPKKQRSGEYHFGPGEEMQHDTSPHDVVIGGRVTRVQCASVVLCYSRMRFVQIYPRFTRFECRVFLTQALVYFAGANARCMLDNTSVVWRPGGTGKDAVPSPQMEAFAAHYGFEFVAHAVGDANRSARVERPFHHIEHNFYPGRTFDSFADLNEQAIAWCDTVNAKHRRHLKASPRELFAHEQVAMVPLPEHVPEVYDVHQRAVDADGMVHLHTNRYSVPDALLDRRVTVREYKDRVVIFDGIRPVATHPVLPFGAQQRHRLPEHTHQRGTSRTRSYPHEHELRAVSPDFDALVDALKQKHGGRATRQLKQLRQIWLDYPDDPVHAAVARAREYGLLDLNRLEHLVLQWVAGEYFQLHPTPRDAHERRPAAAPDEPETEEDP